MERIKVKAHTRAEAECQMQKNTIDESAARFRKKCARTAHMRTMNSEKK